MKKIFLHYANNNNLGDMLNVDICENLFHYRVRDTSVDLCNAAFIGSILEDLTKKKKIYKYMYPVKVWGTGFIYDNVQYDEFGRKLDVYAVRGYKTLERLKKAKNVKIIEMAVGDPGLLASDLIDIPTKKYDLGIIPHYIDKERIPPVCLKSSSYRFIDVNDAPMECIRNIAQCRMIISSSLHGLIISDSLGIPNARLSISADLGEYKFEDYYSVYGENSQVLLDNKEINNDTLKMIENSYAISEKQVKTIKEALYKSFPF